MDWRSIYLTLTVFLLSTPLIAASENFPAGSHARSEYLRLRNLDPSGDQSLHAAKWVALANEMNALYLRSSDNMPGRDLLFAADTQMRVYRSNRSPGYLTRAKTITDSLVALPQGTAPEYGEGLLLRGDIAVAEGESDSSARSFYLRAGEANPRLQRIIQQRIQSLMNGTFQRYLPTADFEEPRVVTNRTRGARTITKHIVLDPGHGGFDAGAESKSGLVEKEITLDIAQRVKALLERDSSVAVHLTRTDDLFVPLARRTGFANMKKGDVFVSIHLNASPSHELRGLESYYLDMTDDDASRLLAERENGVPHGGDVDDLSFILSDLIQSGKLEESVELSHHLQASVHRATLPVYQESKSHGVKKGPFYVLVGAHMPCTLIELFFIDNPKDGAKLATDPFRSIVSEGLAKGLTQFARGESIAEAPVERAQLKQKARTRKGSRRSAKNTKT